MGKIKGITKAAGQKHALDKFYTKPEIAKFCISHVPVNEYDLVIEPSAGSGSFFNQIENCVGFDIHPETPNVVKQDWFNYNRSRSALEKVLVIGNPPFGQQNSLALKFINHAAIFADTIAFVLPLSFMKESVQASIHPNFHLIKSVKLPKNSFLLNGAPYNVPCVFQIWEYRSSEKREQTKTPEYKGFTFCKKSENPDLFIQRIGGNAGVAGSNWSNRSINSTYFIKVDVNVVVSQDFIDLVNKTQFPSRDLSVGPRSISKKELIQQLLLTAPFLRK